MNKEQHNIYLLQKVNTFRKTLDADKLYIENVKLKEELKQVTQTLERTQYLLSIRTKERNGVKEAHKIRLRSRDEQRAVIAKLKTQLNAINTRLVIAIKRNQQLLDKDWDGFVSENPTHIAELAEELLNEELRNDQSQESQVRPVDIFGDKT